MNTKTFLLTNTSSLRWIRSIIQGKNKKKAREGWGERNKDAIREEGIRHE